MGRVMGYIGLTILVCVALGLILHRVLIPMLIGAGLLLLGIFIAVSRADSPDPEP
jgi:NADH:ubiquinone oxidoreductase subunit K